MESVTIGRNVCVDGSKSDPALLPYVGRDIFGIKKMKFTHVSGKITCDKDNERYPYSNFGCNTENGGYAMLITKNREKKYLAPDFNFDTRLGGHEYEMFYRIATEMDSTEFELMLDNAEILRSDVVEIWYSQAWLKMSLDNNDGTTCFDV